MAVNTPRVPSVLLESDRELVSDLEEVATAQWGDEWAISIRRWSDETASIHAEHCRGPTSGGTRQIERLMPADDGTFVLDVVTEERSETVSCDVLERGLAPE